MKTYRQLVKEYATDHLAPHGWITPKGDYISVTQDYQTHSELLTHVIGKDWAGDKWEYAIEQGYARIVKDRHGFYLEYNPSKLSPATKTKLRQLVRDFLLTL